MALGCYEVVGMRGRSLMSTVRSSFTECYLLRGLHLSLRRILSDKKSDERVERIYLPKGFPGLMKILC